MYRPLNLAEVCKHHYQVVAGKATAGGSSRLWVCYHQASLSLPSSVSISLPPETLRLRAHPAPKFL